MSVEYVVYVDEAGDEGFGKLRGQVRSGQSQWLVLGGTIVARATDVELPSWRDEILSTFPKSNQRDLHFRKLNHGQKVSACKYFAQKPIGFCAVASNKATIIGSGREQIFKRKQYLYNYLVRYLLERVTWFCDHATKRQGGSDCQVHVTFSRRGGTNYQVMREYLEFLREDREVVRPTRKINWAALDPGNISVENHAKWAGLQIADLFTSATAAALEPNPYGDTEPRYALSLARRYIRMKNSAKNWGLTLIPPDQKNPLSDDQRAFLDQFYEKARAPGP